MNHIRLKLIFLLISTVFVSAVALINFQNGPEPVKAGEKIFLRLNKNSGPVMRGFQYSSYSEGRKAFHIRAAKFNVEKKKMGVFRLSPLKIARFRDAEINFYGETDPSDGRVSRRHSSVSGQDSGETIKHDVSFKGVLTQKMLPPHALRGSVSAICEPVRLNLYLGSRPVTMIQAEKAIVEPRRRRMILSNNIRVISGGVELSTDRLAIYPETGLFEIQNDYVLKAEDKTISGEKLTTDFLLKKIRM